MISNFQIPNGQSSCSDNVLKQINIRSNVCSFLVRVFPLPVFPRCLLVQGKDTRRRREASPRRNGRGDIHVISFKGKTNCLHIYIVNVNTKPIRVAKFELFTLIDMDTCVCAHKSLSCSLFSWSIKMIRPESTMAAETVF